MKSIAYPESSLAMIYTLSLHDALPILFPHRLPRPARRREDRRAGDGEEARRQRGAGAAGDARGRQGAPREGNPARRLRSEEHTSELQSQTNIVCRLLLEKTKS